VLVTGCPVGIVGSLDVFEFICDANYRRREERGGGPCRDDRDRARRTACVAGGSIHPDLVTDNGPPGVRFGSGGSPVLAFGVVGLPASGGVPTPSARTVPTSWFEAVPPSRSAIVGAGGQNGDMVPSPLAT
jgi:hypothetical protein